MAIHVVCLQFAFIYKVSVCVCSYCITFFSKIRSTHLLS